MFGNKKLGFYSSNLENYIDQIKAGNNSYLPCIFCVFTEDSSKHKWKAAQVLSEVLNTSSFDDLYRMDQQMRDTTSMEWSINWNLLNIQDFITEKMSAEEKRAVLVFASFHPNGYIREQAVKALAAYKETLVFILLRCSDWVAQVRQSAVSVLSQRLTAADEEEIIHALPIMEKLRRSDRGEYHKIRAMIADMFESNKSLINKGLRSRDVRARKFCVTLLSNLQYVDGLILLHHIPYERDPFLRKESFQILLTTNANVMDLCKEFLNDKYPPNRKLALQFLYDHNADMTLSVAKKMLMDRNAKVRILAQSIILQKEVQFDLHQCYLDHLADHPAISLYGLGEVGSKEDCRVIEQYLTADSISVVRAAMSVVMHFASATFAFRITQLLSSEYVGIVKTAALLLKKYNELDFETIFQIQENSLNENTKIKCASLLFLSTKWKSLIYTLRLIGSTYHNLEILCQEQLVQWINSYNRSFTVLSENDKQVIKELIDEKRRFLQPTTLKQLLFLSD